MKYFVHFGPNFELEELMSEKCDACRITEGNNIAREIFQM